MMMYVYARKVLMTRFVSNGYTSQSFWWRLILSQ